MLSKKDQALALFDRPYEPIFTPKGDSRVVVNVPDDYLEERFRNTNIVNRFKGSGPDNEVDVKPITLPDLSLPMQLKATDQFSIFIPYHRKMAERLVNIFMGMRTFEDFFSVASYCRQNLNPQLFNYAYSVALLHRPDTKDIDIPSLSNVFPGKFFDGGLFDRARSEAVISDRLPGVESRVLEIPLDYTASDLDEEHRVAYFREDMGINLHHWHWHLVYPFVGQREIVAKDRRGELFYYMHQQLIARYNFERLSNRLARVKRLVDLRAPIAEGYFPKLDSMSAGRNWASRPPNATLRDIDRQQEQIKFDIQDLERWRDRLLEAAQTGRIIDRDGQSIALTEMNGIDILGDLIEASSLSRNSNLYGDLHNLGHVAIALCHDPDLRYLETFSVMGDLATAMRDPVFYRWHAFIDDIFQGHKNTLPQYTRQQLEFTGIRIDSMDVFGADNARNQFNTFWQKNDVNIKRGMDFTPDIDVFFRITHLQHTPFEYRIQVVNNGQQRQGTVRIFMAPKFDERGIPYLFTELRKQMIELDKFSVTLKPKMNTIVRRSGSSTVTIPFNRTFRDLSRVPGGSGGLAEFNYCGCGWPEHMLIPKGNAEGLQAILFVMVSNFQDDVVEPVASNEQRQCTGAMSYCGTRDNKYPDKRPMGFPFDRLPRDGVDNLSDFLTPNMAVKDVVIKFTNRIEPPGSTRIPEQTAK